MYCSNCGKEVNKNAVVCINCGAAINNPQIKISNQTKGQGIASMVLGIIAAFYSLCSFVAIEAARIELYGKTSEYKFGFSIGYILIQLILAIVGICLAVSERKKNKNGFNTSGLWLAIASFIMITIQFIIIITY